MANITIALMGATGTGKSTFINLVSGSSLPVGEGLRSCTPEVQTSPPFDLAGHRVTLIDTPGFDDTLKTDTEILKLISTFLANSYRTDTKLSGIVYMHRISDFKMGGISRRNFSMFRALCGDATLSNVVITTNMWGEVDEARGAQREAELATDPLLFKPVLDRGARMARHTNTRDSALAIIGHFIGSAPLALQVQREIVDEHRAVERTTAGEELRTEEMREAERRQEEAAQKQRETAAAALRAQEQQRARELEALRLQQVAEESRALAEQERMRWEQQEAQRRQQLEREAAVRALAEQERGRKAEEERLAHLRVQQMREQQAQEEARRAHQLQIEHERNRRRGGSDCIIC